jgi:hypothetical protein
MSEQIRWAFNVQVVGGPKVSRSSILEVEAYDVLQVDVPDKDTNGGKATINVQPGDEGVKFLLIFTEKDTILTYKVDGGSSNTLDENLLLIGEGAVKLLGSTQKVFEFTNGTVEPNTVHIYVGRKAIV